MNPAQGRYLHRTAQTQNKRTKTFMPQMGFEPKIPVFEWAKIVHVIDFAAIVICYCHAKKKK
jgi:hypothetical protein